MIIPDNYYYEIIKFLENISNSLTCKDCHREPDLKAKDILDKLKNET